MVQSSVCSRWQKPKKNSLSSALQHNGKMEDVTKSPLRRAPQLTVCVDVSSSVFETMPAAAHSSLGLFAGTTVASAIPSAVFPWRCCADWELAAA
jgi:hypothetical protein